ncbi:glycosyltransferase [Vibrio sp. SS-MA-C1-2]|uniref:glycosyltransferase n=1 Tax=Vibrio sp. SS-MA-C1-2 TaxID=2908646 RepID=UPI001F3248D9|nr:glycosyltransferase [Vibrio sp. SS-MA-C1-2]UJF18227.1 glycosyltransferase [Vibrio sp. SS-MA-C1-2]
MKADEINSEIPKGDYLIHIGRFVKQKRHDILFQAIANMENKLPVVILCHKPEKAMALAKKFNIEDRLIFPSFQKNPYPWIKNAKALLLSSDFEGLPTVLIESLICDTPVVSTDCPHGPKEILLNEQEEFLVHRENFVNLALKTDKILKQPPNIKNAKILDLVTADNISRQYLNLI